MNTSASAVHPGEGNQPPHGLTGAPPAPLLFKLHNVSKVYGTGAAEVVALRAVDLELYRGEFVVLLGASGGGKSTLLNLLGGLDVPTSGTLAYEGRDLARLGDAGLTAFRRARIGFVFQFYNLVPSLTALENVQLVTEISVRPMAPEAALRLVGLGDRMHHFPAQLSGGEQQRVAIARAVAKNPDVLLCDEPTGALDAATGQMVLAAIEQVHRELGTTVILITHNAAIAGMADRVIHLSSGQITGIETHTARLRPDEVAW